MEINALMKRDFITIGAKLDDMLHMGLSESEYQKAGEEFTAQTGHDNPHELLKQLAFCERGLDVLEFALNNIHRIKRTSVVHVNDECDAKCVFVIYNNPDLKGEPFMVRDLVPYADKFVLLSGLESRSPGAGEDLAIITIQRVGGRVPILIQAGCEYAGDYLMAQTETINRNKKLYESLGYRDVNDVIGCYENSVVMLHCDDELYGKIMKQ